MNTISQLPAPGRSSCLPTIVFVLVLSAVSFTTACGGTTPLSGSTEVSVVLTSTANDQLAEFDLGLQSISLTSQSGKTVTLLSLPTSGPPLGAEFTHINGIAEPLLTATVPQDVYTSATVTLGGAAFVCLALGPVDGEQSLSTATYTIAPPTATVNFPSPLTVTGTSMALSLDLLVSQSATIGDCLNVDGFYGFSIAPTFTVTPLTLAASPTNSANGKVMGLDGEITAIGSSGNSLTLTIPDLDGSRPLSVSSDSNTMYQGISGFSALAVGTFIDMDGAIQSDGSVLATRVAVEDPSAGDVLRGPLMEVASSVSVLTMHPHNWQGKDVAGFGAGSFDFKYGTATFAISGQLANLGDLPFVPSFNASNMVPGQEVYISAATMAASGYPVAATMTLMPQTINGTITASSQSGNFTEYTVTLAPYDLFPMLAGQPDQTAVENDPGQIEVYLDSNTQMLNTLSLVSGNTLRFYGLVFNDNGTLRMDCAQVNDGVAFSPQSNASKSQVLGQIWIERRKGPAGPMTFIFTRSQPAQP